MLFRRCRVLMLRASASTSPSGGAAGGSGGEKKLPLPINVYKTVDYARHMPPAYVDRMKRTVPRRVYGNRFGAPDITEWRLHPDDYVPDDRYRPWETEALNANMTRSNKFHGAQLAHRFFALRRKEAAEARRKRAADPMLIFPGDLVQVMVGRDRNKQGLVQRVLRDSGTLFVEGLHTKLEPTQDEELPERAGITNFLVWKEQPLYYLKGEVMLVDPNDNSPCTAAWVFKEGDDDYIRVSERSGYKIPIPAQAWLTSEYQSPKDYLEVPGKDTPAAEVLRRTYVPKVCLFEDEIMHEMGIQENQQRKPTYWY